MRRTPFRTVVVGVAAAVVTALLAGCGSDEPAAYNEADVTFASEMVSHHEQAVEMAEMVADRPVSDGTEALAEQLRDEQGDEVDRMCDWLEEWGMPAPDPDPDAAMDMGGAVAGTMSHEQMSALAETPDADFERAWLELMIAHHRGGVDMARTEAAEGRFPAAVDLARRIEATQSAEVARMESLLAATG